MLRKLEYKVSFATPAFLGNAEQQGQWRTPPFKALLRQWWRVVYGARNPSDHAELRQTEGRLFGNAWLKDSRNGGNSLHSKSLVQLRLAPWAGGTLGAEDWPPGGQMERVTTTRDGKSSVPADVYLGFGPVLPKSKLRGAAINTNEQAHLRIVFSSEVSAKWHEEVADAMALVQWFGSMGSRSRNGWGSLLLKPLDDGTPDIPELVVRPDLLARVSRSWEDCLDLDWPHALGRDEKGIPLVWISEPLDNWRLAMGRLANVRVAVRQTAKAIRGPGTAGGIHLLGYPAGSGRNDPWQLPLRNQGPELRLASQLRFKVLPHGDGKRVVAVVFHLPCRLPDAFLVELRDQDRAWLELRENQIHVWTSVHGALKTPRLSLRLLGS